MIEVTNLSRKIGSQYILKDVTLEVETGGILALLGPSGSGKTSLLRLIAGLDMPCRGEVRLSGRTVDGGDNDCKGSRMEKADRYIGNKFAERLSR